MVLMNRPEIIQALSNIFSLKGKLGFVLDETIVPTVNAGDLSRTPYLKFPRQLSERGGVTGGAATFAYVGIQPAPNKLLQVSQVMVTVAAATSVRFCVITAANVVSLGALTAVGMVDLGNEIPNSLSASTVFTALEASGGIGNTFRAPTVPLGTPYTWEIPAPGLSLYGNQGGALVVVSDAVLKALEVAFVAREWPLPGQ